MAQTQCTSRGHAASDFSKNFHSSGGTPVNAVSTRQEFFELLQHLEDKFQKLEPELEVTVRDPDMDLEGYVVVWNTFASIGGPLGRCGKGGTRITPKVSLDEVGMLARIMTLKNAAAGLALGGAKSGLRADPDEPGFERKYRRFVSLIKPLLVENGGVFGGLGFDIGGRPIHPIWACDELGSGRGFTGKPTDLGGTDYDKEGIAGLGVATAAETLLRTESMKPEHATFAVQGLGAMGAAVIRYFSDTGAELKFIADPRIGGTFELPKGAPDALLRSIISQDFDTTRAILLSSGFRKLATDDLLFQEVDVLFPCAVQDVITADNVDRLKTKFIIEGANNPCTEPARNRLYAKKIPVVPDFIANPGGIIAAFVEMTTEGNNEPGLKKAELAKRFTRERVSDNVTVLADLVKSLDVPPAQAGRFMALGRIFQSPVTPQKSAHGPSRKLAANAY